LVLLDVMMPGLDGLEVLRRLRARYSRVELPVIMATAKDQSEDVVEALRAGANDYVTKPLDFQIVQARVETHLALKRSSDALDEANRRMRRDLTAAGRLQRALLPPETLEIPPANFAWSFEPCEELAGDGFNVLELDERTAAFYMVDVSGHGVPASLMSVTLSRLLRPAGGADSPLRDGAGARPEAPLGPAELAAKLNARFPMSDASPQFFTLFYALLDRDARRLRYVCAGHPDPVLVRADGTVEATQTSEFAVGWFADHRFAEHELQLAAGDRLWVFSDGVNEAGAGRGPQLGRDRVVERIAELRREPLDQAVRALSRTALDHGGRPPADDVSILATELVG
jgi:sigma-B regulation protein RsbU (phosphoserine phosphatase)